MTAFTSDGDLEPTVTASLRPAASRRTKAEALGLVVGVFGILLTLVLALGGPLPG